MASSPRSRMVAAVDHARRELAALGAGRAQVGLVDAIPVRAWGSVVPLSQVAQVAVQPPRALVVTLHDPSLVPAAETALRDAGLGASPRVDGQRLRIELPAPTAERRVELSRRARTGAEVARVAIRTARADAVKLLRRDRAADRISEGQLRGRQRRLQDLVDEHVALIDAALAEALAALGA